MCFVIITMSMFGDYKSYKTYAPMYQEWKNSRDLAEAKRSEYLRQNPNEINKGDIQRSKALLRAIDVMDEYSQQKAENTEVATEAIIGYGLEIALAIGAGLGLLATGLPPLKSIIKKQGKKAAMVTKITSTAIGALLGTIAAFPLYAWAARAEVSASRKGRYEAIKNELNDPKTFAVLTEEQEKELEKILETIPQEKEGKNPFNSIKESWSTVKNLVYDSPEYLEYIIDSEERVSKEKGLFNEELTPKEVEDAKRDQQLLTKLVEKIDIASQDYAENAELATSGLITAIMGFGTLFTLGYEKLAQHFKWKSSSVPGILSAIAIIGSSIFASQIQKQASRVGRFMVKQELLNNPEKLVYVSDEKTNQITDVEVKPYEKTGMLKFLKDAWNNNRQYNKWKKREGEKEKNIAKAMKKIDLSDEQIKDAKRLQNNTFKTFNKVDENSQRYSESIEALGQSIQLPLSLIFGSLGAIFGMRYIKKATETANHNEKINNFAKYVASVLVATLPSIGINAYITKEQKKASRVADMLSIKELEDYKNFADYSRFMDK